jgi:hypothetical protein
MNDVSKPKFEAPPVIRAVKPLPNTNTRQPVASPYNQSVTKGAVTGVKSDSGGN